MTLIVAMMNLKGGVGKTTGVVLLASALSKDGHAVEVWDADPQGSATEWLDIAAENRPADQRTPFTYKPVNVAALKRARPEADFVLIDTPPGDPAMQSAAAAAADLVIVPATPSPQDMSRVWATVDALGASVPAVVLLNMADPRTVLYREAIDALNAEGVPYFDATVPTRQSYKQVHGTTPTTSTVLGAWADVAHEIQEMEKQ